MKAYTKRSLKWVLSALIHGIYCQLPWNLMRNTCKDVNKGDSCSSLNIQKDLYFGNLISDDELGLCWETTHYSNSSLGET